MLVLQAVALVVLVAELAEELREGELDAFGLVLVPGGGAEVGAAFAGDDRLHLLDADHACEVVASGFDLRGRGQKRDAARGAGRLVAPGRKAAEGRVDLGEERTEVALHAVELGGEVADVRALDLVRRDLRILESAEHGLAHQREKCLFSLVQLRAKSVW